MKVRFSPLDKLVGSLNLKKKYSADEKLVLRLFKGWPNTKRVSHTICEDLHRVNLSGHQQIAHFLARVAYFQCTCVDLLTFRASDESHQRTFNSSELLKSIKQQISWDEYWLPVPFKINNDLC